MPFVTDYTALTDGWSRWNAAAELGTPVTIAYCFLENDEMPSFEDLPPWMPDEENNYTAMDGARQNATRLALQEFAKVCGVEFIEVDNPDLANIQFIWNIGSGGYSWAYYPYSRQGYSTTSEVVMSEDIDFLDDTAWVPGDWAFTLLLHEIGHAMGLDHPHEGTLLDPAIDNHNSTVMSYDWSWDGGNGTRPDLGPLDIDALQYLYGAESFADLGWTTHWNDATETFRLIGSAQDEVLIGLRAESLIYAGNGNDTLFGQGGDDTFYGGGGADRMVGGAGNDTHYVDNTGDTIVESYDQGRDQVYASITFELRDHGQHIENLFLTGNANINGAGNGKRNIIQGNAGDNILNGAWGADTLIGGAGNDTFMDDQGADRMIGGLGDDTYHVDDVGDAVIENDGEGWDHVLSTVSFSLAGPSQFVEDLTLLGAGHIDAEGNRLANTLHGNEGNNTFKAGAGKDKMYGGDGADTLKGGSGKDVLRGDAGNDRRFGGKGSDQFIFKDGFGKDTIIDFDASLGTERINLRAVSSITDFADLMDNHAHQSGATSIIDDGQGNRIHLRNVDLTDLSAGDFVF